MPRFFFHISNKNVLLEDCEGVDLPGLQAALERVMSTYRQLGPQASDALGLEFTIADKSGHTLMRVPVPDWQHQSMPYSAEASMQAWRPSPGLVSGHLH